MARPWQAFPSAFSNGINALDRTWVDGPESLGGPGDAAATSVSAENSAFSLLKGIAAGMGVPVGSGDADVNDNAKIYADPLAMLGEMDDAPATDIGSNTAIALMKGILANSGLA